MTIRDLHVRHRLTPEMEVELDLILGEARHLKPAEVRQMQTVLDSWAKGLFGKNPGENAFEAANRMRASLHLPMYAGGKS